MTEPRSGPICARSYDFQISWYPCSGPPLRRPDHNGPPRHPAGWCMRGHAPRGVLLLWVTLRRAIAERWSPHAQTLIGRGVFLVRQGAGFCHSCSRFRCPVFQRGGKMPKGSRTSHSRGSRGSSKKREKWPTNTMNSPCKDGAINKKISNEMKNHFYVCLLQRLSALGVVMIGRTLAADTALAAEFLPHHVCRCHQVILPCTPRAPPGVLQTATAGPCPGPIRSVREGVIRGGLVFGVVWCDVVWCMWRCPLSPANILRPKKVSWGGLRFVVVFTFDMAISPLKSCRAPGPPNLHRPTMSWAHKQAPEKMPGDAFFGGSLQVRFPMPAFGHWNDIFILALGLNSHKRI